MPPPEARFLTDAEGNRTAYWISGPDDGLCISLIHGWTGGRHEFEELIPALNSAGFRTFAMNQPGHRDSDNVADLSAYSMEAMADRLHSVMARLNLLPSVQLGFSMGGAIADEFAIRHPESTSALVLLGSAGFNWIDDQAQLEIDEAEPIVFSQGMRAHYDVWKQRTEPDAYAAMSEEELEMRRDYWARTSPHAYVGTLTGLRDKRNTFDDLAALDIPTLIVHGDRDEQAIRDESSRAHQAIASSVYHVVPNAGHFAHEDNAADFVSALTSFLDRIR